MELLFDGAPLSPTLMTYRQLGFGQPAGVSVRPYSATMTASDLSFIVASCFDRFVEESRADDIMYPGDPPDELCLLNYPTFAELLERDPTKLGQILQGLLSLEFLGAWLDRNEIRHCRAAINCVSSVSIQNAVVTVRGDAYRI